MFSNRATKRVEHGCLTCRALGSNPSFSTFCVTLDRLLNLSGPQFPHFYNENKGSIYFTGLLLQWVNGLIHIQRLSQCLEHGKNLSY